MTTDRTASPARPASRSSRRREPTAPIGYYFGDDTWSIEHAAELLGGRLTGDDGLAPQRWRANGATTSAAMVGERLATGALFGGGTIAVVSDPGPLLRAQASRDAFVAVLATVAPGNGLAILDSLDRYPKDGRLTGDRATLAAAVEAAGGEVRGFPAPKEGGMARWIDDRARERGVRLGRGAAQSIAERVGAFVREGDVDRRRQGQMAVAELDKLALYRLDGEVSVDDVRDLVPEAVPSSTWALLDAIAWRHDREAAALLDGVLDLTPEPVVMVQLHRRIRELIQVADLLGSGAPARDLPRLLGLHPFRAQTLARQAAGWTLDELEEALNGLLDLDATIKGAGGAMVGERPRRLAFTLWVADRVVPR